MKRHINLHGFTFHVADTYAEMSGQAADLVLSALKQNPRLLLCASAGGTPTGMYERLAAAYSRTPKLFSKLRVIQIDEWAGLSANHPVSCKSDLEQKLTGPLRVSADRFISFDTAARNPEHECRRMAYWLAANGPIDICILGLGANGHIAMNEPGKDLIPGVHPARLTPSSRKHGMLANLAKKPKAGFTLGMADILRSRQVLLVVSGSSKRQILKRLLKPRVSTSLPASFLWLHANAVVICDREAAGTHIR